MLEDEGYHLRILNTADITGIPQHRERMFLVAFLDAHVADAFLFDFPKIEKRPIQEFLEPSVLDHYLYAPGRYKENIMKSIEESVTKQGVVFQYRRLSTRENKSGDCPTLTANMGGGGHNVPLVMTDQGIRKLTPRECFRLQGFPDTYRLSRALSDGAHYKLAGNAVTLTVVRRIAERIVRCLG